MITTTVSLGARILQKLNLGACDQMLEGYTNVDIAPPADFICDLGSYPWPWYDDSVEEILAHDVLEHLPDRIKTMNELHRILIPGGRADIIVPNAAKGAGQWQDPTHQAPFCMNSFQYFEAGSFAQKRLAKSYGITASFKIVSIDETRYMDAYEEVFKIHAVLEAVK